MRRRIPGHQKSRILPMRTDGILTTPQSLLLAKTDLRQTNRYRKDPIPTSFQMRTTSRSNRPHVEDQVRIGGKARYQEGVPVMDRMSCGRYPHRIRVVALGASRVSSRFALHSEAISMSCDQSFSPVAGVQRSLRSALREMMGPSKGGPLAAIQ